MSLYYSVQKWLKEHAGELVFTIFLTLLLGSNIYVAHAQDGLNNSIEACSSMCLPQQSEFIQNETSNTCWCYTNETTLNKAK